MRKQWPIVLAGLVLILIPGSYFAFKELRATRIFTEPFEDVYQQLYAHHPEWVSMNRPVFLKEGREVSINLTDRSPQGIASRLQDITQAQNMLAATDLTQLDPAGQLDYRAVELYLQDQAYAPINQYIPFILNPVGGLHLWFPLQLAYLQSTPNKDQAEYYLTRLKEFPTFADQVIAHLDQAQQLGMLPPKMQVEEAMRQIEAYLALDPKQHVIYQHLAYQLAQADPLDMNETQALYYLQSAERFILEYVSPSWRTILSKLRSLVDQAPSSLSVTALTNGQKIWQQEVQSFTGRAYQPDELHRMGIAILDSLKDLDSSQLTLLAGPFPPASQERDSIRRQLRAIRGWTIAMGDYALGLVDSLPQTAMEIWDMPAEVGPRAPNALYAGPALDGSRPAMFWANLRYATNMPLADRRLAFYQHGVPGMHYLTTKRLDQTDLPEMLRSMAWTGVERGWQLYTADVVVEDLGLLYGEPRAFAGYFQTKRLAVARLIVDTGIHFLEWDADQATTFLSEAAQLDPATTSHELARIIAYPGLGCADWLGYVQVKTLREKMANQLGDQFLVQEFHEFILNHAYLPFPLLHEKLDILINEKLAS